MAATATTHTFAWYGAELTLPEAWNLTFHRGDAREGVLRFADLHATRLELRWRTAKKPADAAVAMARAAEKKRHNVVPFPTAWQLTHEASATLLAPASTRLFELHFPDAADADDAIIQPFLADLPARDAATRWRWSVYGASGETHRKAVLRKTSLVPGAARLEFSRAGLRTTLGSWSMAERLLAGSTLKDWAAASIPLIKNNPAGTWYDSFGGITFSVDARAGLFFRRVRHTLFLTHDVAANRILWTQHTAPPGAAGEEAAC